LPEAIPKHSIRPDKSEIAYPSGTLHGRQKTARNDVAEQLPSAKVFDNDSGRLFLPPPPRLNEAGRTDGAAG